MIGENKSVGRKNKYGMLAQNFNRRTNVAMEHNLSLGAIVPPTKSMTINGYNG